MLFSTNDFSSNTNTLTDFGISAAKSVRAMKNVSNDIDSIYQSVEQNEVTAFWTDGHFSLYQLIATVLSVIGPSHLHFATWSITEEPIRAIWQMKENGLIKSIFGVVDHRIKVNSPKGFQFATSFFDELILAKSHAKITVLTAETQSVAIIGSANWTKNPRLEAGIIIKSDEISEFYKNMLLDYDTTRKPGN
jgi:hypothetical protein